MKAFPSHFVLLADYGDVAGIITEKYAFTSLGVLNKESIAHILLNFCITESIDCIIPLYDFELEPLAKSAVLFDEYGIQVLLPEASILQHYVAEKASYQNFAIFINGECIFSTEENFQKQFPQLNGVFGYNEVTSDLKLFTI